MNVLKNKLRELFEIDVRSLGIFRISIGFLILIDLYHRSSDLVAHYTDVGILPTQAFYEYYSFLPYNLSLHALSGSAYYQALLFLIAACFAVSLTLGYKTRLSAIASWVLLLSLQDRNVMILYGGDVLLRVILFWALFLPLGECFSIDSFYQKVKAKTTLSAATVGYLLQVCIIYWAASAFKWNEDWIQGNAVAFALNIDQFATPLGLWLKNQTALLPLLTYATLYLELLGPFFAFIPYHFGPFRTATVLAFALLHMGFGLCLTLGLFSFISIAAWLPFLPSWFWDTFLKKMSKDTSWSTAPIRSPAIENYVVAGLIIYVIFWNYHTLHPKWKPPIFGNHWYTIGSLLHVSQQWNMFSKPLREDGWYVIEGELLNGQKIDLFRDGQPLDWDKPPLVSSLYKNDRWRKYMMNLWWRDNERYRDHFVHYLCYSWNSSHSGLEKLSHIRVYFILEKTEEDLQIRKTQRVMIKELKCGPKKE